MYILGLCPQLLRTNLIQLNRIKLCAALAQQLLGLATVRAVMMLWTLVLVADMVAGEGARVK
jgi:hypothetical protein